MKKIFLTIAAIFFVAQTFAQVCAYDRQTGTIKIYKLIPRVVTVNSTGQKMQFAGGNLQYTKSSGEWSIMDRQYDMVETVDQNVGENYASQDVVSLFGWGTSGYNSKYPYMTSSTSSNYGPSGQTNIVGASNGRYDWGVYNAAALGDASWRTLTKDEWVWIIGPSSATPGTNCRTSSTVNGTENARWTQAKILTDVVSGTEGKDKNICGLIIFPDDYTGGTPAGVTWGAINERSAWETRTTKAGWEALEAEGCIFLPAAGYRTGTTTGNVGEYGRYWSTTAYNTTSSYYMGFISNSVNPQGNYDRYRAYSVRLVRNVP